MTTIQNLHLDKFLQRRCYTTKVSPKNLKKWQPAVSEEKCQNSYRRQCKEGSKPQRSKHNTVNILCVAGKTHH